jgi:hypothetical protein
MPDGYIDLEPPRAQVTAGRLALTDKLELIPVHDDVFHVVERLKRIDPGLHLSFNRAKEVFVLEWRGINEQGEMVEDFVGAYTELDSRLVNLIERLSARENRNRYVLSAELEKLEARKDREAEHAFNEKVGPAAEMLASALKQDLQAGNRAFMHQPKRKTRKRTR